MERKIDFISLRARFRIENVPVFLLRQRPEQYVKPLHSVTSEALSIHVLIVQRTDEPKSPFPKQQHHTSPLPNPSSLLPDQRQLLKSLVQIFYYLLPLNLLPNLYWPCNEAGQVLLFCLEKNKVGYFFVNLFYMHSIDSPRHKLKNLL